MKRILSVSFFVLLCLCGCTREGVIQQMTYPTKDMSGTPLYDINELRTFFVPHHMDYALHTGALENMSQDQFMEKMLTYQEVDQQFPAEILETENPQCKYIMYPVCQGGIYYVFLSYFQTEELGEQTPKTTDYMYVRFTAYLGDANTLAEYSSVDYYKIKPGVTTMSDVMKLDPYAEPVFLSGGTYTCSMLDTSTILQIQYRYKQANNKPDSVVSDSLVAIEVAVKKIEDSVSIFTEISR